MSELLLTLSLFEDRYDSNNAQSCVIPRIRYSDHPLATTAHGFNLVHYTEYRLSDVFHGEQQYHVYVARSCYGIAFSTHNRDCYMAAEIASKLYCDDLIVMGAYRVSSFVSASIEDYYFRASRDLAARLQEEVNANYYLRR